MPELQKPTRIMRFEHDEASTCGSLREKPRHIGQDKSLACKRLWNLGRRLTLSSRCARPAGVVEEHGIQGCKLCVSFGGAPA